MKKIVLNNKTSEFNKLEHFLESLENSGFINETNKGVATILVDKLFHQIASFDLEITINFSMAKATNGFTMDWECETNKLISEENKKELGRLLDTLAEVRLFDDSITDLESLVLSFLIRDDGMSSQVVHDRNFLMNQYFGKLKSTKEKMKHD